MNRREEYELLKDELTFVEPIRDDSVGRAKKKCLRTRVIGVAVSFLGGILVFFSVFTLAVNSNPKIAIAAMEVPVLKDLLGIISYSESLTEMVENDHVQYILETEEKNGITVHWDYLIVDEVQANLVFQIDVGNEDPLLNNYYWTLRVLEMNGEPCFPWGSISFHRNDDGTRVACIERKKDAPDQVVFLLTVEKDGVISEFKLPITVDKDRIHEGKVIPVNQEIKLQDQTLIVDSVELYPTHTRINVKGVEGNSKEAVYMDYQILTGLGENVERVSNGIYSIRTSEYPDWIFLRAESLYYKELEAFDIIFTNVKWQSKYYVEGSKHEWNGEVIVHVDVP